MQGATQALTQDEQSGLWGEGASVRDGGTAGTTDTEQRNGARGGQQARQGTCREVPTL